MYVATQMEAVRMIERLFSAIPRFMLIWAVAILCVAGTILTAKLADITFVRGGSF